MRHRFDASPLEVAHARSFVRAALADAPAFVVDDLVLAASELVTNAILHGCGDVEVGVDVTTGRIRMEVLDDGGDTEPTMRTSQPGELSGRGLAIVDHIADRWGSEQHDSRRLVWLEKRA